jgi:hypothetical protein
MCALKVDTGYALGMPAAGSPLFAAAAGLRLGSPPGASSPKSHDAWNGSSAGGDAV